MDATVRGLGNRDFYVTATVARWHGATRTFTWVSCGQPRPLLVGADGAVDELEGPTHEPLGVPDASEREFVSTSRRLAQGDRLVLVTDGITERQTEGGGQFGVDGIRDAVAQATDATAAATAMGILQGVNDCWRDPLVDDATVVVLCVD